MLDRKSTSVFAGESTLGSVVGSTDGAADWLVGESVCGVSARSGDGPSLMLGIKYVTSVTPIKIMTAKSINFQFALSHLFSFTIQQFFCELQGLHRDVQSQVLSFLEVGSEQPFE